jgi:hypothetical protein
MPRPPPSGGAPPTKASSLIRSVQLARKRTHTHTHTHTHTRAHTHACTRTRHARIRRLRVDVATPLPACRCSLHGMAIWSLRPCRMTSSCACAPRLTFPTLLRTPGLASRVCVARAPSCLPRPNPLLSSLGCWLHTGPSRPHTQWTNEPQHALPLCCPIPPPPTPPIPATRRPFAGLCAIETGLPTGRR